MSNTLLNWGRASMVFTLALVFAASAFDHQAMAKDEAKKKPVAAKAGKGAKAGNPWIKLCPKMKKGQPKLCVTRADYLDRINMIPYAPIAIEEIEGKGSSIVVTLPNVWLVPVKGKDKKTKKEVTRIAQVRPRWAILSGVIVKIDENKVHKLNYVYCDQFGCVAQAKASKKLLDEMKKGKRIFLAGRNGKQPLGLPFTLAGFGKAVAGKAADDVAYTKAWRGRMAAIRKQRIALVNKQRAAAIKAAQKKKK